MGNSYLWVKALHIVFVASWFAGLFYLPRFFVNLATVPADSALVLGLLLWLFYGVGLGPGQGWMHAKLALVLLVIGYHHACRSLLRGFEQGTNRRSHRWFRVFNEVSVLAFAAIVVLVVVKPF
jgi:putative membrane protein